MKCYLRFLSKKSTICPKLLTLHNFRYFKKHYVTNFVQSQFWWIVDYGLMVLDTSLYIFKFCPGRLSCSLYYPFMELNMSELYCFGSRMQKIVFINFIIVVVFMNCSNS